MPQGKSAAGLARIVAALEALTDAELHALKKSCNSAPQLAPGLLVWIEGACDWEWNRRAGRYHELLPPEAPIDLSEDGINVSAMHAMRAMFTASGSAPEVLRLFDALAALLAGDGERKH